MSKLVSRALVRAGFVVDAFGTCADGREAISLFHYDAAILDLGLPDGDGLTLLAARDSVGRSIPVLILTAKDTIEDRVGGLDAGADDYLVKPFAMRELIARTKALLRRPGSALGSLLTRSEEHTSELQSRQYLVCRLLLEKKDLHSRRLRSLRH